MCLRVLRTSALAVEDGEDVGSDTSSGISQVKIKVEATKSDVSDVQSENPPHASADPAEENKVEYEGAKVEYVGSNEDEKTGIDVSLSGSETSTPGEDNDAGPTAENPETTASGTITGSETAGGGGTYGSQEKIAAMRRSSSGTAWSAPSLTPASSRNPDPLHLHRNRLRGPLGGAGAAGPGVSGVGSGKRRLEGL